MFSLFTYGIYLAMSFTITFRVGNALAANGLVFLINQTRGNNSLAKAINNLLLIGFYLINIGYILLIINLQGFVPEFDSLQQQLNFLTFNLGLVILVLGLLHMLLLYVFSHWRPSVLTLDESLIQQTAPKAKLA